MAKSANPLVWIGLTGCMIFGSGFMTDIYRAYRSDRTIWWTPQAMSLSVEDTRGAFELYVGDKLLQEHLADGTLIGLDDDGRTYRFADKDIKVRLNNWHEAQAGILGRALASGFGLGVALTLLLVGIVQTRRTAEPQRPAKTA